MKIRELIRILDVLSRVILRGGQLTLPIFVFVACTAAPELQPSIEIVQPTIAALTPTSTPEPTPTETPMVQPLPTPVCSGNRLMFNMVVNGIEKAPVDGLYIACSDGSYTYQLTNTSSSLSSISPDGKRMAFATTYYDYKSTEVLEIVDMSDWSEIFKIENITPGGAIWSTSWSPDSEYVLYRRSLLDYDYDDAIEVIHVDSGTVSRVLYQDEIYHTAWSPDGQRVAYSKIGLTIYTMGIECDDSTHRCKRTDDPRLIFSGGDQPSWSPDGTQIVAVCPKLGSLHETLCLMDVEGNLIQEFDHGLWFITGPVWSPDGSMIAFCAKYAEGGGNDMYILSVDDASLTNLTADSDLLVGLPMWLPDERTSR